MRIASHGVTPDEVEQVFANDKMDIDYDVVGGEERWTERTMTMPAKAERPKVPKFVTESEEAK